jgi:hypothetical protein
MSSSSSSQLWPFPIAFSFFLLPSYSSSLRLADGELSNNQASLHLSSDVSVMELKTQSLPQELGFLRCFFRLRRSEGGVNLKGGRGIFILPFYRNLLVCSRFNFF